MKYRRRLGIQEMYVLNKVGNIWMKNLEFSPKKIKYFKEFLQFFKIEK